MDKRRQNEGEIVVGYIACPLPPKKPTKSHVIKKSARELLVNSDIEEKFWDRIIEKNLIPIHKITDKNYHECVIVHPTVNSKQIIDCINGTSDRVWSGGRRYFEKVKTLLDPRHIYAHDLVRTVFNVYDFQSVIFGLMKEPEKWTLFKWYVKNEIVERISDFFDDMDAFFIDLEKQLIQFLVYYLTLGIIPYYSPAEERRDVLSSNVHSFQTFITELLIQITPLLRIKHKILPWDDCLITYNRLTNRFTVSSLQNPTKQIRLFDGITPRIVFKGNRFYLNTVGERLLTEENNYAESYHRNSLIEQQNAKSFVIIRQSNKQHMDFKEKEFRAKEEGRVTSRLDAMNRSADELRFKYLQTSMRNTVAKSIKGIETANTKRNRDDDLHFEREQLNRHIKQLAHHEDESKARKDELMLTNISEEAKIVEGKLVSIIENFQKRIAIEKDIRDNLEKAYVAFVKKINKKTGKMFVKIKSQVGAKTRAIMKKRISERRKGREMDRFSEDDEDGDDDSPPQNNSSPEDPPFVVPPMLQLSSSIADLELLLKNTSVFERNINKQSDKLNKLTRDERSLRAAAEKLQPVKGGIMLGGADNDPEWEDSDRYKVIHKEKQKIINDLKTLLVQATRYRDQGVDLANVEQYKANLRRIRELIKKHNKDRSLKLKSLEERVMTTQQKTKKSLSDEASYGAAWKYPSSDEEMFRTDDDDESGEETLMPMLETVRISLDRLDPNCCKEFTNTTYKDLKSIEYFYKDVSKQLKDIITTYKKTHEKCKTAIAEKQNLAVINKKNQSTIQAYLKVLEGLFHVNTSLEQNLDRCSDKYKAMVENEAKKDKTINDQQQAILQLTEDVKSSQAKSTELKQKLDKSEMMLARYVNLDKQKEEEPDKTEKQLCDPFYIDVDTDDRYKRMVACKLSAQFIDINTKRDFIDKRWEIEITETFYMARERYTKVGNVMREMPSSCFWKKFVKDPCNKLTFYKLEKGYCRDITNDIEPPVEANYNIAYDNSIFAMFDKLL